MLDEIRTELIKHIDEDYRRFNIKTNPGAADSLGVRIPILRKLAKDVIRGDFREFLKSDFGQNFEENMIRALVIAGARMETSEKLSYVAEFIPRIHDWCTCDIFCGDLKVRTADRATYWDFITKYKDSKAEFAVRFMLVMMLKHYLTPDYQAQVLDTVNENKNTAYYVEMAAAWLIAESFAKNYELTIAFMTAPENRISDSVYRKALQKARESYRLTAQQKQELLILRALKNKK